jgi:NAD(P)-dependent dehydrogenase (short-subunit alcohol dehydrogenase family)
LRTVRGKGVCHKYRSSGGAAVTDKVLSGIPIGRFGTPRHVASAVCFFLAPDSGFVTAQNLYVCGRQGRLRIVLSAGTAPGVMDQLKRLFPLI